MIWKSKTNIANHFVLVNNFHIFIFHILILFYFNLSLSIRCSYFIHFEIFIIFPIFTTMSIFNYFLFQFLAINRNQAGNPIEWFECYTQIKTRFFAYHHIRTNNYLFVLLFSFCFFFIFLSFGVSIFDSMIYVSFFSVSVKWKDSMGYTLSHTYMYDKFDCL